MSKNNDDNISKSLNMMPLQVPKAELEIVEAPLEKSDEYDLNEVRQTLHRLSQKGEDALDEIISIAKQGQDADMFSLIGPMIKELSNTNKKLIETIEVKDKLKKSNNPDSESKTVVNNVFTTEELLRQYKNKTINHDE